VHARFRAINRTALLVCGRAPRPEANGLLMLIA